MKTVSKADQKLIDEAVSVDLRIALLHRHPIHLSEEETRRFLVARAKFYAQCAELAYYLRQKYPRYVIRRAVGWNQPFTGAVDVTLALFNRHSPKPYVERGDYEQPSIKER